MLLAHATGFHGHAYLPIAKALAPRFHSYGMDFRGHGDTPLPPDGWAVDGMATATTPFAAAAALAALPGARAGSSGSGTRWAAPPLVMAAARRPELFRLLVLFEPIIFPIDRLRDPTTPNPLRDGARRRRAMFDSLRRGDRQLRLQAADVGVRPRRPRRVVRHGFRQDGDPCG